mmetsp:Transcript_3273/g.8751  ORF Transcript_3273/g.8751 Transcript_3273/m.8751 type:complete len:332 (-) Transcript_3273:417-1412(-)
MDLYQCRRSILKQQQGKAVVSMCHPSFGCTKCNRRQPPIVIMGLFCVAAISNMPACLAFLRRTAAPMMRRRSSSVAPPRIASRRLTSLAPNRHTFRLPSAMRRSLLHSPQKCEVMDVTKEIMPTCPGTRKFLATSPFGSANLSNSWWCSELLLLLLLPLLLVEAAPTGALWGGILPSPLGRLTSPGPKGSSSMPAPWHISLSFTPTPGVTSAALKVAFSMSVPPASTNLLLMRSSRSLGDTPRLRQSSTHTSGPPLKPTRIGLKLDTMQLSSSSSLRSPVSIKLFSSPRLMFHSCVRPSMSRLSSTHTLKPLFCSVVANMRPRVPPHTHTS